MPRESGCNAARIGGIAPRVGGCGTTVTRRLGSGPVAGLYDLSHYGGGSGFPVPSKGEP